MINLLPYQNGQETILNLDLGSRIMYITEITMYRTDDGKTFPTMEEAKHNANIITATKHIKNDDLYGKSDKFYYHTLNIKDGEELYEFLSRNSNWVRDLMGWK